MRRPGWTIHALNVRTTHVHVVVTGEAGPERVMEQLKAWASRRLNRSDPQLLPKELASGTKDSPAPGTRSKGLTPAARERRSRA